MFCLRSWVPLLIFLTNASPIYVLLFLSATYLDRRPCVYCSILLFVLVFSLFDFNANWFEPRWTDKTTSVTESAGALISGNATLADVFMETAGFALAAINGTGGSLASAAIGGIRRRLMNGSDTIVAASVPNVGNGNAFEVLRAMLEKRQIRIPCVDVIVRL